MKALVGCEADLDLPGGVEGDVRNWDDIAAVTSSLNTDRVATLRYAVMAEEQISL